MTLTSLPLRFFRHLFFRRLGLALFSLVMTVEVAGFTPSQGGVAAAYAQTTVTEAEATSYARAVLEMEGPRTQAHTEIKNLLMAQNLGQGNVPMRCDNVNVAVSDLPRNVRSQARSILTGYCEEARRIVLRNNLRLEQFNAITAAHRQDPALANRIQQIMLELQQQSTHLPALPNYAFSLPGALPLIAHAIY